MARGFERRTQSERMGSIRLRPGCLDAEELRRQRAPEAQRWVTEKPGPPYRQSESSGEESRTEADWIETLRDEAITEGRGSSPPPWNHPEEGFEA